MTEIIRNAPILPSSPRCRHQRTERVMLVHQYGRLVGEHPVEVALSVTQLETILLY